MECRGEKKEEKNGAAFFFFNFLLAVWIGENWYICSSGNQQSD